MLKVVAKCQLKSGAKSDFIKTARELIRESKLEAGNISYDLYEDLNDENKVAYIEEWKNQDAFDFHRKTEHYTRLIPILRELQEGTNQVAFYKIVE